MTASIDSEHPAGETTASNMLDMSGVTFAWPGTRDFALAVDSFALPRGSRTLLLGPSGSGKSTLLSLVCGINAAATGKVMVNGSDLTRMSGHRRDRFRAEHIGVIFQMFNLLPFGSVRDNVLLPLRFAPQRRTRVLRHTSAEEEADRILAALGVDAGLYDSPAATLSVGQQQRVAVARALIGAPELIIADEPTSALDRNRQKLFLDLLFTQAGAAGSTLLMVSHDETLSPLFDRAVAIDDIAKTGVPA